MVRLCVPADKKPGVYEVGLPPEDSAPEADEVESEGGDEGMKRRGVGAAVKVFNFIMKQSYICALIAMMVSGV